MQPLHSLLPGLFFVFRASPHIKLPSVSSWTHKNGISIQLHLTRPQRGYKYTFDFFSVNIITIQYKYHSFA